MAGPPARPGENHLLATASSPRGPWVVEVGIELLSLCTTAQQLYTRLDTRLSLGGSIFGPGMRRNARRARGRPGSPRSAQTARPTTKTPWCRRCGHHPPPPQPTPNILQFTPSSLYTLHQILTGTVAKRRRGVRGGLRYGLQPGLAFPHAVK
jgi:hypothetical protein